MVCNLPRYHFAKLRSRWKRAHPERTAAPPLVLDRLHTPEVSTSTELAIVASHTMPVLASQSSASVTKISVDPVAQSISKTLWEQAIDQLNEEDCKGLNFTGEPKIEFIHELMKAITEKQKDCLEKRWSYQNSSGKRVYVRDSVDAFIEQLNKYASIGDVIIQHHPDIVALAWAGFRLLLQVATSDMENMKTVMESMDTLVRVFSRCDIYEKLYCGQDHDSTQPLDGSMVDLYLSVLRYLCAARRYLEQPTAGRVLGSILSDIKPLFDNIQRLEEAVTRDASIAHQQALAKAVFDNDLKVTQLLALLEAMNEPTHRMEGIIMAIYTSIQGSERGKVLAWLSDTTVSDHHSSISSARHADTCGWLFMKDNFRNWEDSDLSSLFWLCGAAGSGKTLLASKMIDRAEPESNNYGRAYFYCNYKEDYRRDPVSILRSLVKQLCQGSPGGSFSERALSIYRHREEDGNLKSLLSIAETQELLIELSAGFKSTTIVIDALDECHRDTREQLLDVLEHILSLTELNPIKIFLTGRNDGDLRLRLEKFGNIFIQEEDNSSDIDRYISSEIETCISKGRLLHGDVDDDLKRHAIDVLRKGAHGMFIWVQHQIRSICEEATDEAVRAALAQLPKGLDDSYKVVLQKIDVQSSTTAASARLILMWILYAFRPLTPDELLEALSVKAGKAELSAAGMTLAKALEICHNLVLVDVALGVLRFTHFSVQEFLLGYYESADAHSRIATVCLTLLTHHHTTVCHDHRAPRLTLEYSTCNWRQHVISSGIPTDELVGHCHEFFAHPVAFASWYSSSWIGTPTVMSRSPAHLLVGPILFAPAFGLRNLFERDLNSGVDPNMCTADGLTALHLAVMNHDLDSIKFLLLRDNVDADRKDTKGRTPLSIAAEHGHERALRCFLGDSRVDVNSDDNDGRTPLSWGASSPTSGVGVRWLLKDKRVLVDDTDYSGRTPLSWAVTSGDWKKVNDFITRCSNVNSRDIHGRTPLSWAASTGDARIVRRLLKNSPKVDRRMRARSPAAIDGGETSGSSRKNTSLLSSCGDIADKDGCTPLLWAVREGHFNVALLLVAKTPYVDTPNKAGQTPLLWATKKGSERLVGQLLLRGANVNRVDVDGRTPLSWAAGNGNIDVLKTLLTSKGIDLNCVDKSGRSPMDWAIKEGHEAQVARILKAAPTRRDRLH